VAANSFLATKISFIDAMAEASEATGADVVQLASALALDERIGGRLLHAGLGFGGGCLPKDIRAFMARAGELGVDQALWFLKEVDAACAAAAPARPCRAGSPAVRCAAGGNAARTPPPLRRRSGP
jgi:UDP-glucose 6-dehydrogenase